MGGGKKSLQWAANNPRRKTSSQTSLFALRTYAGCGESGGFVLARASFEGDSNSVVSDPATTLCFVMARLSRSSLVAIRGKGDER